MPAQKAGMPPKMGCTRRRAPEDGLHDTAHHGRPTLPRDRLRVEVPPARSLPLPKASSLDEVIVPGDTSAYIRACTNEHHEATVTVSSARTGALGAKMEVAVTRSAVIFDLDGTLTRPYLDFDAIRKEAGIESGPILEAMAAMNDARRRRVEKILQDHERRAADNATLYDGAVEVLAELGRRGHPLAVLTRNARSTALHVLTKHGLHVDTLRTREDGAIKPSPEPVLSICAELGTEPEESWLVGDHLMDMKTGLAAGTHTVLMIGEKPLPVFADQAEHVIRKLSELLTIIPRS